MLERLSFKNFTVFNDAEIAFTPGINVLIGANATGKTHAMKVAYALAKSARDYQTKGSPESRRLPAERVAESCRLCSAPRKVGSDAWFVAPVVGASGVLAWKSVGRGLLRGIQSRHDTVAPWQCFLSW